MPTIRSEKTAHTEANEAIDLVVASGATGLHTLASGEGSESLADALPHEGYYRFILYESLDELRSSFVMPKMLRIGNERYSVSMVAPSHNITPKPNESWRYLLTELGSTTHVSPRQSEISELTPLVRSQIELIAIGASPKLQQRLSQFGSGWPDQQPVPATTIGAIHELVAWLCHKSDTVSATVSSDGVLSIATVFPEEVRLYVEIEPDGSAEAAVTRERRYARDISLDTIADLTPEVILAAVRSV